MTLYPLMTRSVVLAEKDDRLVGELRSRLGLRAMVVPIGALRLGPGHPIPGPPAIQSWRDPIDPQPLFVTRGEGEAAE